MQNQRGKLKNLDELLEVAEIQTSYNKQNQLTFLIFLSEMKYGLQCRSNNIE